MFQVSRRVQRSGRAKRVPSNDNVTISKLISYNKINVSHDEITSCKRICSGILILAAI